MRQLRREVSIYVDGSCRDGYLGAGILAIEPFSGRRKQWSESFHEKGSSQDAEILAILHGLRKVVKDHEQIRVHLYSDSQYCIKVINGEYRCSGKHARWFLEINAEARKFGDFQIHKMPAHVGHLGSNTVDRLAKQSTRRERVQIPLKAVERTALGTVMEVCNLGEHDLLDEVLV